MSDMTRWAVVRCTSTLAVALLTLVGCSSSEIAALKKANASSTSTTTPTPLKTVPDTKAGLRAVAHAFAHAWLAGTPADILSSGGPYCASKASGTTKQQEAELKKLRAAIKRETGVAANAIKITGVAVRNYTRSSAEAEVQYDLPVAKAGNDNWIAYKYAHGRWEVADCTLLPIGGFSSSSSTATAP
jgi:hypothetical protein